MQRKGGDSEMKCKNCGSNLDIDTAVCPFCGTPNPVAEKHREDMARFEKDYRHTKAEVIGNSKKFNGRTFRVAAIAVTVAFVAISVLLVGFNGALSFKLHKTRLKIESKKYMPEIGTLIEEEEPLALARLAQGKDIRFDYTPETEGIRYAIFVSQNYSDLFAYVMKLAANRHPSYFDQTAVYITDALNYIKRYSEEGYKRDESLKHFFDAVRSEAVLLIKTYMNLSEEDAENLLTYSDGKLLLVIEEALNEKVKD